MIGVYQITIGNYFYFGSSDNCMKRCLKEHLVSLQKGKHGNKKMQSVFNKHQTFSWEVVEDCDDRGMAYAVEQSYVHSNFGRPYCLNLNPNVSKPPVGPNKGKTFSDEHKAKMSKSKKGQKYPNRKSPTTVRQVCIYCKRDYASKDITRFHNDKCKEK